MGLEVTCSVSLVIYSQASPVVGLSIHYNLADLSSNSYIAVLIRAFVAVLKTV